ncbi:MAG: thiamine phosphate synthase [Candidatus Omnitrophica bacterium]|nr:thiamine phosphate synthase [Candidatus Omnitrophota bacterium]
MNWKKERLRSARLYAITDLKTEDPLALKQISDALQGGVDIIQLRSKTLSDQALLRLGKKIRLMTHQLKKLLIVNDRPDLMLALDADGVHLGQEDLPITFVRKLIRDKNKIIGKSTHSLKQALQAQREGADYVGLGPIFGTPTKPTYSPIGVEVIRTVVKRIRIPVVCIGGIDETNARKVIKQGAERIAVVRAIFASEDAFRAAHQLRQLIES